LDPSNTEYIRHRLERFSRAVTATREFFSKIPVAGNCPASAPYYERCGIRQLFDSLDTSGDDRDNLLGEFRKIDRELLLLEAELGTGYRQLLRGELTACLDVYAAAVCHANFGGPIPGSDDELPGRDRIVVLIHELEKDHDLFGVKDRLRMLDANLSPPGSGTGTGIPGGQVPEDAIAFRNNRRDPVEG
jgi:hypothetical protein